MTRYRDLSPEAKAALPEGTVLRLELLGPDHDLVRRRFCVGGAFRLVWVRRGGTVERTDIGGGRIVIAPETEGA